MTIIAKETFSNGIVSMFKGEIREIADGDPEYTALLEEGLVEEYSAGGGGGGGVLDVTCSVEQGTHGETTYTLNKTWKEIHDAFTAGTIVTVLRDNGTYWVNDIVLYVGGQTVDERTEYSVAFGGGYDVISLMTETETGYPTYTRT